MWAVEFYEKENGQKPAQDFLDTLDERFRAKVIREVDVLKAKGTELREPFSKYLKEGIFELRVQLASNISRVFYFFFAGRKIILTNGFIKKTQKTPSGELDKAKQYKLDYERRN
jgi:phage-related protein